MYIIFHVRFPSRNAFLWFLYTTPLPLYSSTITKTLVLREYEGVLPLVDIYSLLALCSCAAGTFSLCSKVRSYNPFP